MDQKGITLWITRKKVMSLGEDTQQTTISDVFTTPRVPQHHSAKFDSHLIQTDIK